MGLKLIDLSQEIYEGAPVVPVLPEIKITTVATHEDTVTWEHFEEGYSFAAEKIELCPHATTHVDSLSHVDPTPGAKSIEKLPLHWFYTEAICIDLSNIPPKTYYSIDMIKEALVKHNLEIKKGDTVLLFSGHYVRTGGTSAYIEGFSGLSREAAEWIFDQGAINIGQDAPSHDCSLSRSMPAHQVCREKGTLNTENLGDLRPVIGKRFRYIGFPLKIRNGTGSPIRAVAILEED